MSTTPTIVHRLELGLEQQLEHPVHMVAFDVPAGTPSLEVRLIHDRESATIDLGLEGPGGWRGWSGGARDRFVILHDAATPGYLPGELEPGPLGCPAGPVQHACSAAAGHGRDPPAGSLAGPSGSRSPPLAPRRPGLVHGFCRGPGPDLAGR